MSNGNPGAGPSAAISAAPVRFVRSDAGERRRPSWRGFCPSGQFGAIPAGFGAVRSTGWRVRARRCRHHSGTGAPRLNNGFKAPLPSSVLLPHAQAGCEAGLQSKPGNHSRNSLIAAPSAGSSCGMDSVMWTPAVIHISLVQPRLTAPRQEVVPVPAPDSLPPGRELIGSGPAKRVRCA